MAEGISKSELVEFFLVETGEHIQALNEGLLTLESHSEEIHLVDEIFRSAHTIKGSAAMLGFNVISKLAHKMEDVLGKVRSREIKPTESVINLLLQSVDTLAGQIENISRGEEEDASLIPLFESLYREFLEGEPPEIPEELQNLTGPMAPSPEVSVAGGEGEPETLKSELLAGLALEEKKEDAASALARTPDLGPTLPLEISQDLVYFDIRQNKFAVKMRALVEVIPGVDYREEPSAVPIIRGKWSYRGKEIFIIDLKEFFGLGPPFEEASPRGKKFSDKGSLLILKIRGRLMGLLVDQVHKVVASKKIYPYPPMASTLEGRYFEGVAKIQNDLVIVLNEQNLVDDRELEVLKA